MMWSSGEEGLLPLMRGLGLVAAHGTASLQGPSGRGYGQEGLHRWSQARAWPRQAGVLATAAAHGWATVVGQAGRLESTKRRNQKRKNGTSFFKKPHTVLEFKFFLPGFIYC